MAADHQFYIAMEFFLLFPHATHNYTNNQYVDPTRLSCRVDFFPVAQHYPKQSTNCS